MYKRQLVQLPELVEIPHGPGHYVRLKGVVQHTLIANALRPIGTLVQTCLLYTSMLRSLFKGGNGRIPVVIVIEAVRPELQVAGPIHQWLLRRGQVAGMARGGEMWVGADRVATGLASSLVGARMLLLDPALQALVVAFDGEQAPQASWPVDVCDVLVLHAALPAASGRSPWLNWLSLAQYLKPRRVLVNADHPACQRSAAATFRCV